MWVKEILWSDLSSKENDNVQDSFFVELWNLIQSEELKSYFESWSSINNKLLTPELLLKSKKLYDEQIDKLNSHKREIKNSIRENNPEMADWELADNLADERIKIWALESSKAYLRDTVLDYQFDKNSDDKLSSDWKKYKEITHWLLADQNKAVYSEIWLSVAMSFVPMGVWFAVWKLALSAWKWLANVTRLSNLASTTWKLWNLANLSWTVWWTVLKWAWFYEWYEFTHDVMFEKNLSWLDDPKEISKSIAFFGILGWITKLWWILKSTKLTDKIPDWFIKNTWKILTEVWWWAFALVWVVKQQNIYLKTEK